MMRWGGVTLLLFIIWHLLNFTDRQGQRGRRADQRPLQPAGRHASSTWWLTLIYLVAMVDARGRTCTTASGARRRPSAGPTPPGPGRNAKAARLHRSPWSSPVGFSLVPDRRPRRRHHEVRDPSHDRHARHHHACTSRRTSRQPDETPTTPPATTRPASRSPTPRRPAARSTSAGTPASSRPGSSTRPTAASSSVIIVGTGLAGASAAATLGEAGYNVKSFCYQDSPRRAHSIAAQGGINAAKNYKERRRLGLPALLRHRQGRRLPLARVQRLPPGRGQREHHRPVRRAGRPVRPRVRRPARQPLLRRRPGLAHVLRPRPDRPAAADRRLPGAGAAGRRRHREDATPATRCSS